MSQALSKDTKVTVGAAVAVALTVGGGALGIRESLGSMRYEITAQKAEIARIASESMSKAEAAEQALRTAIENPGFRVPDPRDPNKIIVVEKK